MLNQQSVEYAFSSSVLFKTEHVEICDHPQGHKSEVQRFFIADTQTIFSNNKFKIQLNSK